MKRILIVGGYGEAGKAIARLLLRHTDTEITIAGRRGEQASRCAEELCSESQSARANAQEVDASDPDQVRRTVAGFDLVVLATPTVQHVRVVAEAAIVSGADFLDIQISPARLPVLLALEPQAHAAGRLIITEAGAHPGLASAVVRFAHAQLGPLRAARVAMRMNVVFPAVTEALLEFARDLLNYRCVEYRDGGWHSVSSWSTRRVDFGPQMGAHPCIPIEMPELLSLPAQLGLDELSALVAGFHWFTDWVVFPLGIVIARVNRGLGARFIAAALSWSSRRLLRPPFGVAIKLEAEPRADGDGMNLLIADADGYFLTAAPVVACLLQYLDDTARRTGVHLMGHLVDPVRFLRDLQRLGLGVEQL